MLLPVTFFSHSSIDFSNLSMQLLQGIPEDQLTLFLLRWKKTDELFKIGNYQ